MQFWCTRSQLASHWNPGSILIFFVFHIAYICYDIFLAGCSHAFWYEDNDLLMLWHNLIIIIIIMLSSRAPTRNIWGWKQQLISYSDLRGDPTLFYAFKLYYLLGFGWHIVIMSFFGLFMHTFLKSKAHYVFRNFTFFFYYMSVNFLTLSKLSLKIEKWINMNILCSKIQML